MIDSYIVYCSVYCVHYRMNSEICHLYSEFSAAIFLPCLHLFRKLQYLLQEFNTMICVYKMGVIEFCGIIFTFCLTKSLVCRNVCVKCTPSVHEKFFNCHT